MSLINIDTNNAIVLSKGIDELIINKELSKNAKIFLFDFLCNLSPVSNCVLYNGKLPTIKDLEKITSYKRGIIYQVFSELEEKEIMKRLKFEDKHIIYLNPYLFKYLNSLLCEVVLEIFKTSIYNLDNKEIGVNVKCLSEAEYLISKYLLNFKNLILNQKGRLYKDFINNKDLHDKCGTMKCDWIFTFNDKLYIVEYFGLMNKPDYKIKHDLKLELIKEDNKEDNFVAIYPKDFNRLDEVFYFLN